jgi:hypothetical protein
LDYYTTFFDLLLNNIPIIYSKFDNFEDIDGYQALPSDPTEEDDGDLDEDEDGEDEDGDGEDVEEGIENIDKEGIDIEKSNGVGIYENLFNDIVENIDDSWYDGIKDNGGGNERYDYSR